MPTIAVTDVEAMIKLLATVCDPTVEMPITKCKAELLRRLSELIGADAWLWATSQTNRQLRGDAMAFGLVDGGWLDEQERAKVFRVISHPDLAPDIAAPLDDAVREQRSLTVSRNQVMNDDAWRLSRFGQAWPDTGFEHFVISAYPIGEERVSAIGFYRRIGKPPFTPRDRTIVHVMFQQIDWLHRAGSNVPASKYVIDLSPRERQVTMLLIGGDSRKQVAGKLNLSGHTVAGYLKEIYRKLGVNTRAELLAKFIPSGK